VSGAVDAAAAGGVVYIDNPVKTTAPVCKRCSLYEIDVDLARAVDAYIGSLPSHLRAGDKLVRARLRACDACGELVNGMCALCGCFVEARAAKAATHCPKTPAAW